MSLVLDPPAARPHDMPATTLHDPQDVARWLSSLPAGACCGVPAHRLDCPLAQYLRARNGAGTWCTVSLEFYNVSGVCRPLPLWARLFVRAIDQPPPNVRSLAEYNIQGVRPADALRLLERAVQEAAG